MNKHKSKVNPTVEVTVCPGRVYLDYRTGNKRTELSSFVFDRVNGNWRMHIAPGNNKLVSGAFVAATLNQHGSYQRKTITRSEGVERVIFPKPVNLADYDIILVNSSAGKDSQAMLDH